MARYLTPIRITTLLLIELYRKQCFWTYDNGTSSTILSIIAQQCLGPSENDADLSTIALEHDVKDVSTFLKPLATLAADLPGRPWSSILVQRLWNLRTVDELHDLFETCSSLLASSATSDSQPDESQSSAITRASPIGQFIRRCHVEFTRLQFAETIVLWKGFLSFREPSRALWTQQYPDAARQSAALESGDTLTTISDLSLGQTVVTDVSIDTVEAVLTASVNQLQKLGQRVSPDVKARLEQWLLAQQSHNASSLRNFLSFFDAWRAGQYNTALENLHRYFDYAVGKGEGDETKTHYQYALLHLSVLHADFEHWEECVDAMRECISTARENQDAVCLNFALSWLLYLRHSRGPQASFGLAALASIAGEGKNEHEELVFLRSKAREGKHWTLMSSTLLEEAKLEMRHSGICPKAFESIWQSSYLNVQHGLHTLVPATAAFESAALERLGQTHLSRQIYHTLLATKSSQMPLGDRTRTACRFAYDLAQQGLYDQSLALLQETKLIVHGTLKLEQKVIASAELVGLLRAIRRHDMFAADHHMTNLRSARSNADPDLISAINQLELDLLVKQGRLDVALKKVNIHLNRARSSGDNDIAETLAMMMSKASIFTAAGYSQKGFSITLKAIVIAQERFLFGPLMHALKNLAHLLNELGEYDAVKDVTTALLPCALEMSSVTITAQVFVSLGEALVGLAARQASSGQTKYVQLLHTASAYIDRGRQEYRKAQDYDGQLACLLMKARLARYTADVATADNADSMYHQLVVEHEQMLRRS